MVAVNLSLASLARLRAAGLPGVHPVRADLGALAAAQRRFDGVLCANALQHDVPGQGLRPGLRPRVGAEWRGPAAGVVVPAHGLSVPKQAAGWAKEGRPRGPSGAVRLHLPPGGGEFRALLGWRSGSRPCASARAAAARTAGSCQGYHWRLEPLLGRLPGSARLGPHCWSAWAAPSAAWEGGCGADRVSLWVWRAMAVGREVAGVVFWLLVVATLVPILAAVLLARQGAAAAWGGDPP